MSARVGTTMILAAAACSDGGHGAAAQPDARVAAPSISAPREAVVAPPPDAAAPVPDGPREYALGDDVRVRFTVPEGWKEHRRLDDSRLSFSRGRCDLVIAATCGGLCGGAAQLRANLREKAREQYDLVRSPDKDPRLRARWLTKPRAEKPDLYFWRIVGEHKKVAHREEHLTVARILPDARRALVCEAEIEGSCRSLAMFWNRAERLAAHRAAADELEAFCRSIEVLRAGPAP